MTKSYSVSLAPAYKLPLNGFSPLKGLSPPKDHLGIEIWDSSTTHHLSRTIAHTASDCFLGGKCRGATLIRSN
jgi:hypothetical protein